ncbi:MAG TPA: type IV toxin-antitoxin system AbiEi family antitoxin domain-containing protein [Dokdonella sp.]|uniref:type IV toxin-antitoxin system AbiEi family antitoxin domain-containing protein n=1 Tax=Dokdonella sp. TaxID=2291710 RepID=UPI002D807EA7|nr:type IV toxin-antitoxin system AbiEi family antitoxin domain-containing protein [Dokdonella sp.]HET9033330.1 type IV toxin-antitoxin system AbiEi family antitoxin domain-containing protein [Dokdonella sp.]
MNLRQFITSVKVLTVSEENSPSLNRLLADFAPGSLLPTRWLTSHGYADNLLPKYVAGGWLVSAGYGVYRRSGAESTWADAVFALQNLLKLPLHVGGLSALDWAGFSHFLRPGPKSVVLYGPKRLPRWAADVVPRHPLVWHADRLFDFPENATDKERALVDLQPQGERRTLRFASEERAILELLDETPKHASLHEADAVLAGLVRLRPARLDMLLARCTSYKVKRLFLALAHRHNHPWLKHVNVADVDLGRGKRAMLPGGKYDALFQITLPADLDAEFR